MQRQAVTNTNSSSSSNSNVNVGNTTSDATTVRQMRRLDHNETNNGLEVPVQTPIPTAETAEQQVEQLIQAGDILHQHATALHEEVPVAQAHLDTFHQLFVQFEHFTFWGFLTNLGTVPWWAWVAGGFGALSVGFNFLNIFRLRNPPIPVPPVGGGGDVPVTLLRSLQRGFFTWLAASIDRARRP